MSGYLTHLLPLMPVFICKSHPDSEICFTEINRKHNFLFIHIYLCHPASFNLTVFLFKIGLLAGCESETIVSVTQNAQSRGSRSSRSLRPVQET